MTGKVDGGSSNQGSGTPAAGGPGAGTKASGARPGGPPSKRGWMATHGRDLRFLVIFVLLMGLYYAASTTALVKERFFPWYLRVSAATSGQVLRLFGNEDLQVKDKSLISRRGAISVERGCDAVEPSALFVSAVLASPVPLLQRLLAVVVGTAVLMVVNLLRIISLYLVAVHWRKAFDVMHLDVWQAAFIFLAIALWAVWATQVSRRRIRRAHASD